MIEVIYKEEKEAQGEESFVQIPRNIRQIGLVYDNYKIYMEDYVYTFLEKLSQKNAQAEKQQAGLAVLTGETKWWSGVTYLFIRGAIQVEDTESNAEHIDLSDEIWTGIMEEQKQYFGEQEIVGWFFSQPQIPVQMTDLFSRIHLKYFGGEKVVFLMDPGEKEEAFFHYENGTMVKQSGYYIYYQKNPEMQTYMMEKNQIQKSESVEDEAVKKFRKIISEKKTAETEEKEGTSVFSYAATACLVIAALTVGVNFYHNYLNMNQITTKETSVSLTDETTVSATPKPAPATITPGISPVVTQSEKSAEQETTADGTAANDTETAAQNAEEESSFYKEEADVRKAKRREAQENSNAAENTEDTGSTANSEGEAGAENTENGNHTGSTDNTEELESTGSANNIGDIDNTENTNSTENTNNTENTENTANTEDSASANVHESYVIQPGDTLYQISMNRYGSMAEIQEICRLNGMKQEEIIYPGQVIVLP